MSRVSAQSTHAVLRIACGVSGTFVLSEIMGWYPTFLAPAFAAMLLASLPGALPLKAGIVLTVVEAAGAASAFVLSSSLHTSPTVLFGVVGLVIFLAFSLIASGRAFFPTLLVLISFATIPVITLTTPQQAGALPVAFVRGMAVAVITVWLMFAVWPQTTAKAQAGAAAIKTDPVSLAIAGSAIVLPLMLVYLMYGITDALPVLITTIVLVVNFDPSRGAVQGLAMILGNFVGGLVAISCHALLGVAPSLFTLGVLTFGIGLLFGQRIERGGPAGSVALVTFNQSLIMLSLGLMPGPQSTGLWVTRLAQFTIAYVFAVGLMYLILPRRRVEALGQDQEATA